MSQNRHNFHRLACLKDCFLSVIKVAKVNALGFPPIRRLPQPVAQPVVEAERGPRQTAPPARRAATGTLFDII